MVTRRDELLQGMSSAINNFREGFDQPLENNRSRDPDQSGSVVSSVISFAQRVSNGANRSLSSSSAIPDATTFADDNGQEDALPDYSTAAFTHVYKSQNGKLEVAFQANEGTRAPVYVQTHSPLVVGEVRVHLDKEEPVTQVRIRVKGVVRTQLYVRNHQPIVDEMVIMELGSSLWEPEYETDHLVGDHMFPFSFRFPQKHILPELHDHDLPPSFVLPASAHYGQAEAASIKYYVKVTLARKGIWRANDRVFAPIVYLTRHLQPPMSDRCLQAVKNGLPHPGPSEDPEGWTGRNSVHHLRKGMFSRNRLASYEAILLLPASRVMSRNRPIPFYIKILSTDPSATGNFQFESIRIVLIQRAEIYGQGRRATMDTNVAIGSLNHDGPPEGMTDNVTNPTTGEHYIWSRRIKGEFKLGRSIPPSFTTAYVEISYVVRLHVLCQGVGNNVVIHVPIRLLSSPSKIRVPGQQNQGLPEIDNNEDLSEMDSSSQNVQPQYDDLPPSYFDVVESDRRNGQTRDKKE